MLFTVQGRGCTVLLKKEEYDYKSSHEHDASALRVEKVGIASGAPWRVWLGLGLRGSAGQPGGATRASSCQHLCSRFCTLKHVFEKLIHNALC